MKEIWYPKAIRVLLICYKLEAKKAKVYTSELIRRMNLSWSHAYKLVKRLIELGLLEGKRSGRTKFLKLTELGREVAKRLYEIEQLLSKSQGSEQQTQRD